MLKREVATLADNDLRITVLSKDYPIFNSCMCLQRLGKPPIVKGQLAAVRVQSVVVLAWQV